MIRASFFKRAVFKVAAVAQSLFPSSNFVRKKYHQARNWYEGGNLMLSGDQSYLPALIQDARYDQNQVTRRELMRRMRYWSQNSSLLESILSVGERYTVGAAGLRVAFYPSDESSEDADNSWYERAEAVIYEAFENIGWNGESMKDLLKIGYRCQKVDGETFFAKTRKRGQLRVGKQVLNVSKPALQMIEAHRVETPFSKWADENRSVIDGVEFQTVKQDGRELAQKTGYWTRNGFGQFETESSWELLPTDAVIHVFSAHRANQFRGMSDFYSVEQELHKLEDLLVMEMRAQNSQSERAVGIENASGQFSPIDPRIEKINTARGVATNTSAEAQIRAMQQMVDYYRKAYGGSVYAFKQGEKVHFDAPTRPSDATLNLWEFLINSVCSGSKSPRCLIFPTVNKGQGTEIRAQLDAADEYYKGEFQKWKAFVKEAVVYVMEWSVINDPRVADPPADWRYCIHVQQPEACNVDVGWNSAAKIAELASGVTNFDLIYAPRGLSARRELRKLAAERKFIAKLGLNLGEAADASGSEVETLRAELEELKELVSEKL